jgi:NmrA-like family
MQGSTAIYSVTDFFEPFAASGPSAAIEIESRQGMNLARAASATPTLKHYIWSTLPNGREISGGKYVVPHFEAKNRVDAYIKADANLYAKTTFLWITFYTTNYLYPMFTPNFLKSSGKYLQLSPAAASTPIHSIGSTSANVGTFVMAILRAPEISLRKFVQAKVATLSAGDVLATWSRATGHAAEYVKVSLEEFDRVWPVWGREMGLMLEFWDEAKEKSWSGEDIIGAEELGVDVGSLVGVEEAFRRVDWAAVL